MREDDPAASSYWRLNQSFGNSRSSPSMLHSIGHWALQTPFRRIGRKYDGFKAALKLAKHVASRQGRAFDLDILRHAITLSFLRHHQALSGRPVVVIGDGLGTMASLLLLNDPAVSVILVNLTDVLKIDLEYVSRAVPASSHRVSPIEARNKAQLRAFEFDLAINIASMQEMTNAMIADYFQLLREKNTLFYCCNREEKVLPDSEVIRFANYPWRQDDETFVDGLCPWHQRYYTNAWPFYRRYEGPHRHRLSRLTE
jgi:hypothetical protein